MENQKIIRVKLTLKQTECWDAFWNPKVTQILYGGAMGGGKSYIGCKLLDQYATWVIEEFNLKPTKYPINLGFMGRARAVDFNDTTLETWKRITPDHYYIRTQDKEIVIEDKVKYAFGGLDNTEAVAKFSSAEFAVVFIDQAEECKKDDISVLMSRFRLQINGIPLPYKALFTANPKNCFLKDEFVLGNDPKKIFIPALPYDNLINLPPTYIDSLKEAFKHRPELLLANLEGSWDSLEGSDIIIKDIWVRQAKDVHHSYIDRPIKVFGADIARFGDDRTVIYYMEGTDIKEEMIFGQKDTMYTAGRIHIWAQEKNPDLIGVDVIGLGAGVADRLREMGDNVLEINSSEKSSEEEKYRNLRAEMWWGVGRRFAEKDIQLTWDDPELRRELSSVSYFIKNGKFQIELKDDIKKRLGRSPDKADTYIMGLYTLDHASIAEGFQGRDWDDEDVRRGNEYTGV